MYYVGLDVHKKTISYCVKDASGLICQEGKVDATRWELDIWMKTLPQPWTVAMEATIFTGWIYDHLKPHAAAAKVAHPLMLRAIAAAKKKNDSIDATKIADCLRCDFLPECYMAPTEIRERRRTLRYRQLLVRQMVQMKNRVSGLLMETGPSRRAERRCSVRTDRATASRSPLPGYSLRAPMAPNLRDQPMPSTPLIHHRKIGARALRTQVISFRRAVFAYCISRRNGTDLATQNHGWRHSGDTDRVPTWLKL
ncbi:MAG TPA: transposase [Candidatus Solibacter sp.]|nr:transposase [Candidatus Solibacter sp.]